MLTGLDLNMLKAGNLSGKIIICKGYIEHPRHKQKPGTYTDDTQMSLALAELIVEGKSWTPETIDKTT